MKKYLTPISLLLLMFVSLWLVVRKQQTKSPFVKHHQYDYIIEVDGTDSVLVYTVHDYRHNVIDKFTSNNPDSLTKIIEEDNQ